MWLTAIWIKYRFHGSLSQQTSLSYTQMALNLKQVWAILSSSSLFLCFYVYKSSWITVAFLCDSLSLSLFLMFMYYILWCLCITYFIFYILYCISKQNSALVRDCKLLAGMFSCARRAVNEARKSAAPRVKNGKLFSAGWWSSAPSNSGGRKKSRVSGGLTAAQIIGGGN